MMPQLDKRCASQIVAPDPRLDFVAFNPAEMTRVLDELKDKHRDELNRAGWWGRLLIRRKLTIEAEHILRSRLYAAKSST
jgi:hypothetical protein